MATILSSALSLTGVQVISSWNGNTPVIGTNPAQWRGEIQLEAVNYDPNDSVQTYAFRAYTMAHTPFSGSIENRPANQKGIFISHVEANEDYLAVQALYGRALGAARIVDVQKTIIEGQYSKKAKIPAALGLLLENGIDERTRETAFQVLEENAEALTTEDFRSLWTRPVNHKKKLEEWSQISSTKVQRQRLLKILGGFHAVKPPLNVPFKSVERVLALKTSEIDAKEFPPSLLNYLFIDMKSVTNLIHVKFLLALQMVLHPTEFDRSIVHASFGHIGFTLDLLDLSFLDKKAVMTIFLEGLLRPQGAELLTTLQRILINILEDANVPSALKYRFSVLLLRINKSDKCRDLKAKCAAYIASQPQRITLDHMRDVSQLLPTPGAAEGMKKTLCYVAHPFWWGRLELLQVEPGEEHQDEFVAFQKQHKAYKGNLYFKENDPIAQSVGIDQLLAVTLEAGAQPATNWATRALENVALPAEAIVAAAFHLLSAEDDDAIEAEALNALKLRGEAIEKGFVALCQSTLDLQSPMHGLKSIFQREALDNPSLLSLKFQLALLVIRHSEDLPADLVDLAVTFLMLPGEKGVDLSWVKEEELKRMTQMFVWADGFILKLQELTKIVDWMAPKFKALLKDTTISDEVRRDFGICLLQFDWTTYETKALRDAAAVFVPTDLSQLSASQRQIVQDYYAQNLIPTTDADWVMP